MLAETAKLLPKIRFIIAVNGPLDENIDEENLEKVGFVKGRLLQELIKKSEFVVSPSVCTETFGLSNGEALKLGTPVITTRLGAFPETVTDENGCLVEAGNVNALVEAIRECWDNSEKLVGLRNGCKKTLLLSNEDYGKEILKVYD